MARDTASILHVDLDAFFASVEQLLDPALRGRPVIVGGLGGRGVVSAASYEARRFGVHSALPMARARALCPDAVFLPPRFDAYSEKSREVMAVLGSITPLVEQLSVDEAFLDVTGARRHFGDGVAVGTLVRARVLAETGLVVSVGGATTKFLAKLASDLCKPDGLLVVPPGAEREMLAPLPVTRLWGVGPATVKKLERMGVTTIGDVAALPERVFVGALGASLGAHISALARNDDPREVVTTREAKSIGAEETFATDLVARAPLERELVRLADKVTSRARRADLEARTVTLKLRFADFETITRALTLPAPTALSAAVLETARALLAPLPVERGVRLIGISLSQLRAPGPQQGVLALTLADPGEDDLGGADGRSGRVDRRAAVEQAVDEVRERFGEGALRPATLSQPNRTPPMREVDVGDDGAPTREDGG